MVQFASGSDPIFASYKSIIGPDHLTPHEALAKAYKSGTPEISGHLSVISWILPISAEIHNSNRVETRISGRRWAYARWYGEKFNDALRQYIKLRRYHGSYPWCRFDGRIRGGELH